MSKNTTKRFMSFFLFLLLILILLRYDQVGIYLKVLNAKIDPQCLKQIEGILYFPHD